MKKTAIFLAFFLCLSANGFTQKTPGPSVVHLKDGSQIRGMVTENAVTGTLLITLADGAQLKIAATSVSHVSRNPCKYLVHPSGRRILAQGWYTDFGAHTLVGKQAGEFAEGKRLGLGVQTAVGYRFNRWAGLAGGIGVDVHEQFFTPVYLEFSGILSNDEKSLQSAKPKTLFLPLTYSLQVGHNFPFEEKFFDPDEFVDLKGSWLIYPAVGVVFPSRKGHTFKLDFGYKFQRFTKSYDWQWWGGGEFEQTDVTVLKSFAVRAGWGF